MEIGFSPAAWRAWKRLPSDVQRRLRSKLLEYSSDPLANKAVLVGRLWTRVRSGKESATFEYDKEWIKNPHRFSLEPALSVTPGPHHTPAGRALFGALADSSPDRWGRTLMKRAERKQAEREGRNPRTLFEADVLLMVDDEARQGALRFAEVEGGPFLRDSAGTRIPPHVEIARLLSNRGCSARRSTLTTLLHP